MFDHLSARLTGASAHLVSVLATILMSMSSRLMPSICLQVPEKRMAEQLSCGRHRAWWECDEEGSSRLSSRLPERSYSLYGQGPRMQHTRVNLLHASRPLLPSCRHSAPCRALLPVCAEQGVTVSQLLEQRASKGARVGAHGLPQRRRSGGYGSRIHLRRRLHGLRCARCRARCAASQRGPRVAPPPQRQEQHDEPAGRQLAQQQHV